jgi:hypothetical protein
VAGAFNFWLTGEAQKARWIGKTGDNNSQGNFGTGQFVRRRLERQARRVLKRYYGNGIIAVQVGCVLEVREQLINKESQLAGKFWGE